MTMKNPSGGPRQRPRQHLQINIAISRSHLSTVRWILSQIQRSQTTHHRLSNIPLLVQYISHPSLSHQPLTPFSP
ncbi:hypothetical protein VNO78_26017 [Psophocarpus tetragonolobus]|uniref:Uncharacterized protein n=1 Tax=Psophocarpus tetragonolobus TaxID=3891 RepID=A0AAN9XFU4_PSOTE